jgi:hypothetical protein
MSHYLLTLFNSPVVTALLATRTLPVIGLTLTAMYARTENRRQTALRVLAILLGRRQDPRT